MIGVSVLALTVHVLLTVLFFHTIRSEQVRGRNIVRVAAVNYLVASLSCIALSLASGNLHVSGSALCWGAVHGAMFAGTFYLLCTSMSVSGMAIATAIVRLSVVIPVAASILVWQERPTGPQVAGIAACIAALPLIGLRKRAGQRNEVTERSSDEPAGGPAAPGAVLASASILSVAALFLGMGIANVPRFPRACALGYRLPALRGGVVTREERRRTWLRGCPIWRRWRSRACCSG